MRRISNLDPKMLMTLFERAILSLKYPFRCISFTLEL